MTQSRVKRSWPSRRYAGERLRAPPGANTEGANEAIEADRADCGDHRVHVCGRSCVIHMLWNGFLFTGLFTGLFAGAMPHRQPADRLVTCGLP